MIDHKAISPDQLELALKKQKVSGGILGSILLEMGFISEEALFMPILAGQMNVEFINLKELTIPRDIIQKISPKIAAHYRVRWRGPSCRRWWRVRAGFAHICVATAVANPDRKYTKGR